MLVRLSPKGLDLAVYLDTSVTVSIIDEDFLTVTLPK